jgi:hypothetical protein
MSPLQVRSAIAEYEANQDGLEELEEVFLEDEREKEKQALRLKKSVQVVMGRVRNASSGTLLISLLRVEITKLMEEMLKQKVRKLSEVYMVWECLYNALSQISDVEIPAHVEALDDMRKTVEQNRGRELTYLEKEIVEIKDQLKGFRSAKESYHVMGDISFGVSTLTSSNSVDSSIKQMMEGLPKEEEIAELFKSKGINAFVKPYSRGNFWSRQTPCRELCELTSQEDYDQRYSYHRDEEIEAEQQEEEDYDDCDYDYNEYDE